jgi:hypothetical protein
MRSSGVALFSIVKYCARSARRVLVKNLCAISTSFHALGEDGLEPSTAIATGAIAAL